ncbi:hypothetical protein HGRIS_003074 [Hohenbuehelia grisea]|uniref:Gag protein n=1 Tax=Hohenbuehelia grisea TaxID=104357 RepID=A0ABR3JMM4_9AGAR
MPGMGAQRKYRYYEIVEAAWQVMVAPPAPSTTHERLRNVDMPAMFEAFREFMRIASVSEEPKYIPPQIPVSCRGETRVFGRKTLAGMSYSKAIRMFRRRFQQEGDETHVVSKIDPNEFEVLNPDIAVYATFIGASTAEQRTGLIDESSWQELLKNVESINIIITRVTGGTV